MKKNSKLSTRAIIAMFTLIVSLMATVIAMALQIFSQGLIMKYSLKLIILSLIMALGITCATIIWLIKFTSIVFYVALGINLTAIGVIVVCLILEVKHNKKFQGSVALPIPNYKIRQANFLQMRIARQRFELWRCGRYSTNSTPFCRRKNNCKGVAL